MFDRTAMSFARGGDTHHHTTLVDPSVEKGARFLKDLEAETEKRITNRVLMGTEGFTAQLVVFDMFRDVQCMQTQHHLAYKLNGRDFRTVLKTSDWGDRLGEEVAHNVATALSAEIMTQIFQRHLWSARY